MRTLPLLAVVLLAAPLGAGDWPQWRGPTADGAVTDPDVPRTWSATENVLWKVPVEGVGRSSPIVASGKLFLTSCVEKDRVLLCYDAVSGKRLWRAPVASADPEKMHKNNTPASSTPVTDGRHVWTTFLTDGAIVVSCHDLDGKPVWAKRFDGFTSAHGFCGTPILYGELLVVNGDSDGEAFLAALEKETGAIRWKVPRPNRIRSFSTPVVLEVGGKPQLVLAGSKSVAGFDPKTGEQIWVIDSGTQKFVATVAYAGGVVVATGTSPEPTLVGIRPDGRGNVTRTHVVWAHKKGAAYVPSPLAVGSNVFVQSDDGQATFLDAKTGKVLWTERLGRHHDASPLLVNGLIHVLADDGTTHVIKPGPEFDLVGKNSIGEACHATPAVANGRLYIRSAENLWCIAARK